jgi:hypothetical protein
MSLKVIKLVMFCVILFNPYMPSLPFYGFFFHVINSPSSFLYYAHVALFHHADMYCELTFRGYAHIPCFINIARAK